DLGRDLGHLEPFDVGHNLVRLALLGRSDGREQASGRQEQQADPHGFTSHEILLDSRESSELFRRRMTPKHKRTGSPGQRFDVDWAPERYRARDRSSVMDRVSAGFASWLAIASASSMSSLARSLCRAWISTSAARINSRAWSRGSASRRAILRA